MRLAQLTGFADGPAIEPPPRVVAAIERLGAELGIDAMARVTERAEIWSYGRNGTTSCGGATRLLRAADDWIALSLTREDDEALVPAWIGVDPDWAAITTTVRSHPAHALVERGRLLGLPIARLRERAPGAASIATRLGDAAPLGRPPVVVDLSSLWAGPLCTRLLA